MDLYEKLKKENLVENYKDYLELFWIRAIEINGEKISNPKYKIKENDKIKIGILNIK